MYSRQWTSRLGALLALLIIAALMGPVTTASAAPADDDFYQVPDQLPDGNGTVVRSEPAEFFLDPLRVVPVEAQVERIMYTSTDRTGERIGVTGTVIVPHIGWFGRGERPLVAFTVGTQGLGDQCAPSRQLAAGTEYEGTFIAGLVARGYAVVIPDYEGLGTPGNHTYLNRQVTGQVVLDSIRAAQDLATVDIADDGPVAISGYSQGGAASASAAELAPNYAPELDLVGAVAGATPGDLGATGSTLDGGPYVAFLLYTLSGLRAGYEIGYDGILNDAGFATLERVEGECSIESVARSAFTSTKNLTVDGRPIGDWLADDPALASAIADQRIGDGRRPAVPMLVTHSVLDDVVPYRLGKDLARRWCAQGARVDLSTNLAPTHVGGAVASYAASYAFLEARFAGWWTPNDCWWL